MRLTDHNQAGCQGPPPSARSPVLGRPTMAMLVAATMLVGMLAPLSIGAYGPAGAEAASSAGASDPSPVARPGGNEDLSKIREYARCMRAHGIDFPEPGSVQGQKKPGSESSSGGHGTGRGPDPNSPGFQAARRACLHYLAGVSEGWPGSGGTVNTRHLNAPVSRSYADT